MAVSFIVPDAGACTETVMLDEPGGSDATAQFALAPLPPQVNGAPDALTIEPFEMFSATLAEEASSGPLLVTVTV